MRIWVSVVMLVMLTQCVGPPSAPPPPPPKPVVVAPAAVPTPLPPRPANWEDWPLTPGDWSYARDARGSVARYGPPGADAHLVLRCLSEGRRIFVSRPGRMDEAQRSQITLRATTGLQSYPLATSNEAPPYLAAEIAASDRHLDAIAFSRGRFLVQSSGAPDLVIPAWPEFARVVEDCRG